MTAAGEDREPIRRERLPQPRQTLLTQQEVVRVRQDPDPVVGAKGGLQRKQARLSCELVTADAVASLLQVVRDDQLVGVVPEGDLISKAPRRTRPSTRGR